jgi:hypothetical protein
MSEANGKRILSLDGTPARKAKDAGGRILTHNATVEEVHQIVAAECAKVHEHYLNQIPHFVARMIQDALLGYGLIVPQPGADIAPVEATPETADAIPSSGDTPPADTTAPAEPTE